MKSLDDLFTITCGSCRKTAPVADWTTVGNGHFQCPSCALAFKRERKLNRRGPWEKFIELVPVNPVLKGLI